MKKILVNFLLGKIFSNSKFSVKTKEIYGINLYVFADQHVGRKILLNSYEKSEAKFFMSEIKNNDICLDVGANIGYFSFLFSKKSQKVYSIEPIRSNAKLIELTASVNNINNIEVINSLASDGEGFEDFIEATETSLSGIKKKGFEKELKNNYGVTKTTSYKVASIKIDSLIFPKLDLVKIDVEGAELKVLRGMTETLKEHKPRILMIEAVPSALELHGDSFDDLIDFLHKLKYEPMILKSNKLEKYQGGYIPNDNLYFKYKN